MQSVHTAARKSLRRGRGRERNTGENSAREQHSRQGWTRQGNRCVRGRLPSWPLLWFGCLIMSIIASLHLLIMPEVSCGAAHATCAQMPVPRRPALTNLPPLVQTVRQTTFQLGILNAPRARARSCRDAHSFVARGARVWALTLPSEAGCPSCRGSRLQGTGLLAL